MLLLKKHGLSKRLSAVLLITLLCSLFLIILIYLTPAAARQATLVFQYVEDFDRHAQRILNSETYNRFPEFVKEGMRKNIVRFNGEAEEFINGVFKGMVAFAYALPSYILTPVFIYYFLTDSEYLFNIFIKLIPPGVRERTRGAWKEIDEVIGSYVKSQIILSVVIAAATFAALAVLKVKYALIIGIVNGFTNIIPYFGPVLGLIPALLAAASDSVAKTLITAAVFFIIQQAESSILAPYLMGDSMGIHPVVIIIAVVAGGEYFGAAGLILAAPVVGSIKVLLERYLKRKISI